MIIKFHDREIFYKTWNFDLWVSSMCITQPREKFEVRTKLSTKIPIIK